MRMCQCENVANAQPQCPVRFRDTAVASAMTASATSFAATARGIVRSIFEQAANY